MQNPPCNLDAQQLKASDITFEELIDEFSKLHQYDLEIGAGFLTFLHEVAGADGVVNSNEMEMLTYAERSLRLIPGTLDELTKAASTSVLEAAYQMLECDPTMTDSQIKLSYRRKCVQFHPDKLHSADLAPEFLTFANEQLVKINQAYEQICVARSSVVA